MLREWQRRERERERFDNYRYPLCKFSSTFTAYTVAVLESFFLALPVIWSWTMSCILATRQNTLNAVCLISYRQPVTSINTVYIDYYKVSISWQLCSNLISGIALMQIYIASIVLYNSQQHDAIRVYCYNSRTRKWKATETKLMIKLRFVQSRWLRYLHFETFCSCDC